MKLSYRNYALKLEYPFGISNYTRTSHDTVLVTIERDGITGFGEASSVRYLGETTETINAFLDKVQLEDFKDPERIADVLDYVDGIAPGNTAAKTGIDLALHDLTGKIRQEPCYRRFGADPDNMPATTFTIGIDTVDIVREKVRKASGFKILKIKLGSDHDREIIEAVRAETNMPLSIDANQGWKDRQQAVDMIGWLKEKGTVFVEQPMDKDDWEGNAWVTANSPLPVIADEAMQRIGSLDNIKGAYHGINIKLMKCTGLQEGFRIIQKAREMGLKIMIGCMSETSCGIMAGAALAPLADWADLDSPWLITNNPYKTPGLTDGKIVLTNEYGLGLSVLN